MSETTKVLSNEYLKGIITDAVVSREYCSDLDTCFSPGVYYTNPETLNLPDPRFSYATVLVFSFNNNIIDQFVIAKEYMVFRHRYGHNFYPWMLIQANTLSPISLDGGG